METGAGLMEGHVAMSVKIPRFLLFDRQSNVSKRTPLPMLHLTSFSKWHRYLLLIAALHVMVLYWKQPLYPSVGSGLMHCGPPQKIIIIV